MDYLVDVIFVGVAATAFIDVWAAARKRALGIPLPNYALLGRWLAHLVRGRFRHDSIATATPVPGERLIGWAAHYLIGVAFAGLVPTIWGIRWLQQPTIAPALVVGIATVAAPFLLMQPGMGSGIAASRMPNPRAARLQSVVTHLLFGVGLYLGASAVALLRPQ